MKPIHHRADALLGSGVPQPVQTATQLNNSVYGFRPENSVAQDNPASNIQVHIDKRISTPAQSGTRSNSSLPPSKARISERFAPLSQAPKTVVRFSQSKATDKIVPDSEGEDLLVNPVKSNSHGDSDSDGEGESSIEGSSNHGNDDDADEEEDDIYALSQDLNMPLDLDPKELAEMAQDPHADDNFEEDALFSQYIPYWFAMIL